MHNLAAQNGSRRGKRLALLVYGLIIGIIVVPATIIGDRMFLSSGVVLFEGGYTIFTDVLYAIALYVLPLLGYETLRTRATMRPSAQRG